MNVTELRGWAVAHCDSRHGRAHDRGTQVSPKDAFDMLWRGSRGGRQACAKRGARHQLTQLDSARKRDRKWAIACGIHAGGRPGKPADMTRHLTVEIDGVRYHGWVDKLNRMFAVTGKGAGNDRFVGGVPPWAAPGA